MENKILLIGKKAILDALEQKKLISATISNRDIFLLNKLKQSNIKFTINNDKKWFDKISNNTNHQFCIGYVNNETLSIDLKQLIDLYNHEDQLIVILDSIEDPQNFGSIIRTCEFLGVKAIIYKKNNQCPINSTVIKVSAGALSNIYMVEVINLSESIRQLKKNGFWIYASCLDKDSIDFSKVKYDKKNALVIGNENSGISRLVLENCDFKIKINNIGKTQSLNVACATSILVSKILEK